MSSLKFIAISGTTSVTQNMYIYEYENDMVVVDCGVGFPELDMYGVDLIIPDFTYVRQNANKLKGILITHGHEDHIGALPFLLKEVKAPVYSTKLVAGFVEDKLLDYQLENKVNIFNPDKDTLSLGVFKVTPFRVSHSVPDSVGFCLDTPEGRVFHIPDHKFDWTPVDGKPFDVAKLATLASEGTLAVASDCLGSTSPGYTESEKEIETRIEAIVRRARGQIFFTTISSNISRVQQALNVAKKVGRSVVFIGRSIDKKAEIAKKLGYLNYPNGLIIRPKKASNIPASKIMYIISGSYGQVGSALYKVSLKEHDFLNVNEGDIVIFSSDPAPPGSKTNVDFVVDKLIEANAEVHYYDMQEDLHVSGHGSMKDIEMLFSLVRPKYFIPIGGTIRHMRAYGQIARSMGKDPSSILELMPGDVVEFKDNFARLAGKIPVKDVLVDGLGIGDVGNVVLRDRQVLAKDGIAIVMIQVDRQKGVLINDPDVISRGFVYEGQEREFLKASGRRLKKEIERKGKIDARRVRDLAINFLEKYFFEETGRRPMVLPVVVEV